MRSGDNPRPSQAGDQWDAGDESAERTASPDLSRYYRTLYQERDWRRANREVWENEVEAWAMAEAAAGRKFSVAEAVQRIRWHDRADGRGGDLRVNDHWAPIWSRLLVKLHPELAGYVVQRRTPWDWERFEGLIG